MAAPTEAVLLGLKNSHSQEVLVLTLNTEVHVRINHVLKLIGARHLTRLIHLVDNQSDSVGILTELKNLLKNKGVRTVSLTVTVMGSIHLLERVDDKEHLLARICIHHLLAASDDVINLVRVTACEVATEVKAVNSLLDLEERLFRGVEDTHCVLLLSDSRSDSENHSGLTSTRLTGEESDRRWSETSSAHGRVDKVNTGFDRAVEVLGNLDCRDVSAKDNVRERSCDSHVGLLLVGGT